MPYINEKNPTDKKTLSRAVVLGAGMLVVGVVANRLGELRSSDNPFGLSRSTGPGSGVTETVPISGREDLPEDPKELTVTVKAEEGDTVWDLTRKVLGPDTDIRNEVDSVLEARGGSADLQPGDTIEVPVPENYQPPQEEQQN